MSSKSFTALLIRLSLGFIYMSAGLNKLAPGYIGHLIGPPDIAGFVDWEWLIEIYPLIAVIQVLVGGLILTQRYSLLGLLALLPLSIGIFVFTIVAGFRGTPFVNAFLLGLNLFVLWVEKDAIRKLWQRDFSGFSQSPTAILYPAKRLPQLALALILITAGLSFFSDSLLLNVFVSVALLLFTINLFQVKEYLWVDKLIVALFFVICFGVINTIYLNSIISKTVHAEIFALIPLGFLLYFLRLIISGVRNKKISP